MSKDKDYIEYLEDRLEINYGYDIDGNRVEIKPENRRSVIDGITCRDLTIDINKKYIKSLEKENKLLMDFINDKGLAEAFSIENNITDEDK